MDKFDSYTIHARIIPVLIVILPVLLVLTIWASSVKEVFGGTVATACLYAIIAQVGRDFGKKSELKLFETWGGMPSTRMLRHSGSYLSVLTLNRYHKKLINIVPNVSNMPTKDQERQDPKAADTIYASCADWLRVNTRSHERFPLVYEENKNYGFRRNVFGLRLLGITVSSLSALLLFIVLGYKLYFSGKIDYVEGSIIIFNLLLVMFWVFYVSPAWVRVAAEEYAKRLVEACDRF